MPTKHILKNIRQWGFELIKGSRTWYSQARFTAYVMVEKFLISKLSGESNSTSHAMIQAILKESSTQNQEVHYAALMAGSAFLFLWAFIKSNFKNYRQPQYILWEPRTRTTLHRFSISLLSSVNLRTLFQGI